MSGSVTTMQNASKFTELFSFALEFMSFERLKKRRFEEGLAFNIRNQLAGQPILTYQELYEWAVKVEWVKAELKGLDPINQKRKLTE